jgi:hypothetical protein
MISTNLVCVGNRYLLKTDKTVHQKFNELNDVSLPGLLVDVRVDLLIEILVGIGTGTIGIGSVTFCPKLDDEFAFDEVFLTMMQYTHISSSNLLQCHLFSTHTKTQRSSMTKAGPQ